MANTRFYQFLNTKVPSLCMLQCEVIFGATGAVTSFSGAGIASVTRLTTGIYQVTCNDNYNAFLGGNFMPESVAIGSPSVTSDSFVTGTLYQITQVISAGNRAEFPGLAAGLTPTVGQCFVATGVGTGNGVAQQVGPGNADHFEVNANSSTMLGSSSTGAVIIVQCYQITGYPLTVTTASGNPTLTVLSVQTAGLTASVGQMVSGAGIPLGTYLTAVGSNLTMSQNATASASLVPIVLSPARVLSNPRSGSGLQFQLLFRNSSALY